MCRCEHDYALCPCLNENCKAPKIPKGGFDVPPHENLRGDRKGHYKEEKIGVKARCDAWDDAQLIRKDNTPIICDNHTVAQLLTVADELCKDCRHKCKQDTQEQNNCQQDTQNQNNCQQVTQTTEASTTSSTPSSPVKVLCFG